MLEHCSTIFCTNAWHLDRPSRNTNPGSCPELRCRTQGRSFVLGSKSAAVRKCPKLVTSLALFDLLYLETEAKALEEKKAIAKGLRDDDVPIKAL